MKYQEFKPFWHIEEHQMDHSMTYEEERKYTKWILWFFLIFTIVGIILIEFIDK